MNLKVELDKSYFLVKRKLKSILPLVILDFDFNLTQNLSKKRKNINGKIHFCSTEIEPFRLTRLNFLQISVK